MENREKLETSTEQPPPEVIIYTTPTCTYCKAAKDYLTSRKIEFTEIDVANDKEKAIEMVRKSQQKGVPVLEINGRIVVGFNRPLIDDALQKPKPLSRDAHVNNLIFDPFTQ